MNGVANLDEMASQPPTVDRIAEEGMGVEDDAAGIEIGEDYIIAKGRDDDCDTVDYDGGYDDNAAVAVSLPNSAEDLDAEASAASSSKLPCLSRRNKLVAILASFALIVLIALSVGLTKNLSKKHSKGESIEMSSAMAADTQPEAPEEQTHSLSSPPSTTSPMDTPLLSIINDFEPLLSISNDFEDEPSVDGESISNDFEDEPAVRRGSIRRGLGRRGS